MKKVRVYFLITVMAIVLTGCTKEKATVEKVVEQVRKEVQKNSTDKDVNDNAELGVVENTEGNDGNLEDGESGKSEDTVVNRTEESADFSDNTTEVKKEVLNEEETAKKENAGNVEIDISEFLVESKENYDYIKYNEMSAKEQEAFIAKFDSMGDFVAWYNEAKAEYEKDNPAVIIDGTTIDATDWAK